MDLTKDIVDRVWTKGRATADQDPDVWRKDECGAWINYEHYGSQHSEFGWKIVSVSAGSSDDPDQLRPFHRENDFDRNTGRAVRRVKANRDAIPPTAKLDTPQNTAA